jgi:hypothetical protein
VAGVIDAILEEGKDKPAKQPPWQSRVASK